MVVSRSGLLLPAPGISSTPTVSAVPLAARPTTAAAVIASERQKENLMGQ